MMSRLNSVLPMLSRMWAKNFSQSPEVSLQENIRWNVNRLIPQLGWPGLLAVGLLAMSVPFFFSAIRPLQSEQEQMRLSLNSDYDQSQQSKANRVLDNPVEQLAEFYDFFPSEKESPRWLGLMVDIANKNRLSLNHGEYTLVRDSVGQLRRFRITLPVTGNYPQIRKYLSQLIAEVPYMSLENVQFERKDVEESELQAKIVLVLYMRQAS
jgi:hypothetical protein